MEFIPRRAVGSKIEEMALLDWMDHTFDFWRALLKRNMLTIPVPP